MVLNVSFHLLPRLDKVIISLVHFIIPLRSCRIYRRNRIK
jgi:hypothetical protein